jgi:hypothetical protein
MLTATPPTAPTFQREFKFKFHLALLTVSSITATGLTALAKDIVVVMCSFQWLLQTVADLVLHAKWSAMIARLLLLELKNAGLRTVMMFLQFSKVKGSELHINKVSQ